MAPLAEDALIRGLLGLLPFLAGQALGKRRDGLLPNRTKPREKNSYSDGKLAAVGNALANGHCQGDIPPCRKTRPDTDSIPARKNQKTQELFVTAI